MAIFTAKHLCWSLFNNVQASLKRDSKKSFYCEYCEIFNNTYFEEHFEDV